MEAEDKLRYQPGHTYGWHQRDKMTAAAMQRLSMYPEWQVFLDWLDKAVRLSFRTFMDPEAKTEDALKARSWGQFITQLLLELNDVTDPDEQQATLDEEASRLWDLMQLDLDRESYDLQSQYALHRLVELEDMENPGGNP